MNISFPITIPSRRWLFLLLVCAIFPMLSRAQTDAAHRQQLTEVVNLVEQHFYDPLAVSGAKWAAAVQRAQKEITAAGTPDEVADQINALLATLQTSHTHYYHAGNPKRYQLLGVFNRLYDDSREDLFVYEGIGIATRREGNYAVILAAYDGFPAKQAGLRFGDRLLSVDGQPFHPINSFLAKAGKEVTLSISRNGEAKQVEVEVKRLDGRTMFEVAANASVEVVEAQGKQIGYIHLWSYAGMAYQELLRQEVLWGRLADCDAMVLDLRDGWGGADITYLNLFRPPIANTWFRGRDGTTGTYNGVWGKPVVLLVNERSTSGKEMFTYGFKKLGLGPVVGSTTAGAVVAGRSFLMPNGDVLYLAVRDVRIDHKRLEGRGVAPDFLVQRSAGNPVYPDPQRQRAVERAVRAATEN
jgi:carboxyl-terminal processing protease